MAEISYALGVAFGMFTEGLMAVMLLRVVFEMFANNDNPMLRVLCSVTEPFVVPARMLLSKVRFFSETAIDVPFFVSCTLLAIINLLFEIWY